MLNDGEGDSREGRESPCGGADDCLGFSDGVKCVLQPLIRPGGTNWYESRTAANHLFVNSCMDTSHTFGEALLLGAICVHRTLRYVARKYSQKYHDIPPLQSAALYSTSFSCFQWYRISRTYGSMKFRCKKFRMVVLQASAREHRRLLFS